MKRIFFNLSKVNWQILVLAALPIFLIQNAIAIPRENTSLQEKITEKNKTINEDLKIVKNAYRSRPYIGVEAGFISEMLTPIYSFDAFRQGYGSTSHQKNPMLYGIFFGKDLNDSISVEIGYETQHKKERIAELNEGDILPGLVRHPLGPNDVVIMYTTGRTEYWNAGLKVKIKDYMLEGNNTLTLWTMIGASYSQIRATQQIIADEQRYFNPAERAELTRSFKSKRVVPSARVGLDYQLSRYWVLRSYCGIKNLKLLKAKPKERPDGNSEIKLKDSIQFSLGLTYRL